MKLQNTSSGRNWGKEDFWINFDVFLVERGDNNETSGFYSVNAILSFQVAKLVLFSEFGTSWSSTKTALKDKTKPNPHKTTPPNLQDSNADKALMKT